MRLLTCRVMLILRRAVVSEQHVRAHLCEDDQQGLIRFFLASSAPSTTGRVTARCGTLPWTDPASPSSQVRTAAVAGAAGSSRSTATGPGRSTKNVCVPERWGGVLVLTSCYSLCHRAGLEGYHPARCRRAVRPAYRGLRQRKPEPRRLCVRH